METKKDLSWSTIYRHWNMATLGLPEIHGLPQCLKIPVSGPLYGPIYHFNWIKVGNEEPSVQENITTLSSSWLDVGTQWSKGTLHTAAFLTSCKTGEEAAAVWLHAFSLSLIRDTLCGCKIYGTKKSVINILTASSEILPQTWGYWHHNSKDFFPSFYIPYDLFEESQLLSVPVLVKLAAINASLVMTHYTPVEYKNEHNP